MPTKEFNYFESQPDMIFEPVFEMANIPERIHRLGMAIKLNVAQPGDRQYPHGPRVKVFKNDIKVSFEITLDKTPEKMKLVGDYSILLNRGQYTKLLAFVKRYRMPLLNLWHHQEMDVDEFEAQMKAVDAGVEIVDYNPASGTFVVK